LFLVGQSTLDFTLATVFVEEEVYCGWTDSGNRRKLSFNRFICIKFLYNGGNLYFCFLHSPMKKILIAGTIAFDEVTTPFGHSGRKLGGSATFLSFASSFFSPNTAVISIVGNDFPEVYLDKFRQRNIDISGVEISKEHKTFYWKGLYYENLNKRDTLITEVNALAYFNPVVPEAYRESDLVILGNLHPGIQQEILNQLKRKPDLVVLDTMNFWMDTAWDSLLKVISRVDLLMVNEEEARQLTGKYTIVQAAKKILRMGPKYVIIKQGEYGSILFSENEIFYAPAYPLEQVADPTGAGDTFAGGFAGHLSQYDHIGICEMKNALIYASNLASFTVEDFGTGRLERITFRDIEERFEEFMKMMYFPLQQKLLQ
jgi:sugar/nucleoside kinase (ribokinase family)